MRKRLLLIAVALVLITSQTPALGAGAAPPPAACPNLTPQDSAMVAWLGQQAVPLRTVEPEWDLEDVSPLKSRLEGVQVIGLGEATHGTREFSTAKHRLLQFLVTQMGVRTVLWEMNYGGVRRVNDYIQGGSGDGETAVRNGVYQVWQTEEVAAMLDWMRSYNLFVPADRRIQVIGFDVQDATLPAEELGQYLQKVAPAFFPSVDEDLQYVKRTPISSYSNPYSQAVIERLAGLQGIGTYLADHRQELLAVSSLQAFQRAMLEAHIVARYYELEFASLKADGNTLRDRLMADTVLELLNLLNDDGLTALWAHNYHVSSDFGTMGTYLRNALGDRYYALGFATGQGEVTARGIAADGTAGPTETFKLALAPAGQLEWYFACAGLGNSYINLRDKRLPAEVTAWLKESRNMYELGWGYPTTGQFPVITRRWITAFDGLVYIPVTTASRPVFVHR